jgi:cobalt-precorrin-5B (C1)-methyltransferase
METDRDNEKAASGNTGLRTGYTTGACAAAAAKAACMALSDMSHRPHKVEIPLPGGERPLIAIESVENEMGRARASVVKDAGDDPDITDKSLIVVELTPVEGDSIGFEAGPGVGTVTRPGLAVPVGEPAINPVPRMMIIDAIKEVSGAGYIVKVSIPGGEDLARHTFNPRLGIAGGLSILGTSGIVRPFSASAIRDSIKCAIDVAMACGVTHPVFVPGRIGLKAAFSIFELKDEQVMEVSNEWGFSLDILSRIPPERLLIVGHPGKLAKLPAGWWDTHSSRSGSAVPYIQSLANAVLGHSPGDCGAVEAVFNAVKHEERKELASALAERIVEAIMGRTGRRFDCAVALVNLRGEELGAAGDLDQWSRKRDR